MRDLFVACEYRAFYAKCVAKAWSMGPVISTTAGNAIAVAGAGTTTGTDLTMGGHHRSERLSIFSPIHLAFDERLQTF